MRGRMPTQLFADQSIENRIGAVRRELRRIRTTFLVAAIFNRRRELANMRQLR